MAAVIPFATAILCSDSPAAQQRPTLRQVLAGSIDLDRFPDELLNKPFPDPQPGRRYVLVDVHRSPSAVRLYVFSSDRRLVRELNGWQVATLPNESIVYHESMVHFAPTHSLHISVFDPAANANHRIYPPSPPDAVRRQFVERVASVYKAVGPDWFRENNHHMDPTRFNSALIDPIAVDERADSMTFLVQFGNRDASGRDPVPFNELVRVTCAPLAPVARIVCREAAV